jgi:hypothetical protein
MGRHATKVTRRSGGIGRRAWFRSMYPQGCGGSSPFFGTITFVILYLRVGDTYIDTTQWRIAGVPNREVNVTKRVQTAQGLRYCSVVFSANGRIKPDFIYVNGTSVRHPEGAYYLEWREGKKRIRLSAGKDAADASARRLRKEAELNAINNGVAVVASEKKTGRRRISDAVAEYLSEIKMSRSSATHSAYTLALRNFTDSCSKTYLEEIDRGFRADDSASVA